MFKTEFNIFSSSKQGWVPKKREGRRYQAEEGEMGVARWREGEVSKEVAWPEAKLHQGEKLSYLHRI